MIHPAKEGFTAGEGISLHYLEWNGGSPPMILLHATGFLARLWEPISSDLAPRFRIYAYDMRGHGDSDHPPVGFYNWDLMAADLRSFLTTLSIPPAIVVGHSTGGAVAAYLAATAPELICGLALIEPIIITPATRNASEERVTELALKTENRRLLWPSREEIALSYQEKSLFSLWPPEMLSLYVEHGSRQRNDGQFELKCPVKTEAEIYRKSLSFDAWSHLQLIRIPTMIIRGQNTESRLRQMAADVSKRVVGSRLVTMKKTSHLLPMEQPQALAAEILDFFDAG